MKAIFFSVILFCSLQQLKSQDFSIDWSRSFGGTFDDEANAVCSSFDTSIIIAGFHWSTDGDVLDWYEQQDIWLVNVSSEGIINWQRTIGGSSQDVAMSICPTNDSSFIVCGYTMSNDGDIETNFGGEDCFIFKINSVGDILWQSVIGGVNSERANSIIQTLDGGYIFTGQSNSDDGLFSDHIGTTGNTDLIVGRLNSFGEVLWVKSLGNIYNDYGNDIIITSDSNYLVVGSSEVLPTQENFFILKISDSGETLWSKTIGGSSTDIAQTTIQLTPNKYLIGGYTYSDDGDVFGSHGSSDAWTIIIDNEGAILSTKCYGGSRVDQWYSSLLKDDNTFYFAGTTDSEDGDVTGYVGDASYPDYWFISIDSLGVIKQQDCFGGGGTDKCYDFTQSILGSFILTGTTFSSDGDVIGYHDDVGPYFPKDAWTLEVSLSCEPIPYYQDFDGDAFGDASNYIYSCSDTIGYVLDNTDCDDSNNLISPAALEVCNTIDDNCNGEIDEDFIYVQQYADMDDDDFGNLLIDTIGCPNLFGFVVDSTDCNDSDPAIHPGATEILNGLDDDCNKIADDGLEIIETELIGLSVFPSPATNVLTIQFENINTPLLTVYNINGDLIFQQNKIQSPFNFDASELSAGLYLIYLYGGNLYATTVFVKD